MTTKEFEKLQNEMSDQELIEECYKALIALCSTGGGAFKMTVPVNVYDTDMLFSQLMKRFEQKLNHDGSGNQ